MTEYGLTGLGDDLILDRYPIHVSKSFNSINVYFDPKWAEWLRKTHPMRFDMLVSEVETVADNNRNASWCDSNKKTIRNSYSKLVDNLINEGYIDGFNAFIKAETSSVSGISTQAF